MHLYSFDKTIVSSRLKPPAGTVDLATVTLIVEVFMLGCFSPSTADTLPPRAFKLSRGSFIGALYYHKIIPSWPGLRLRSCFTTSPPSKAKSYQTGQADKHHLASLLCHSLASCLQSLRHLRLRKPKFCPCSHSPRKITQINHPKAPSTPRSEI